MQADELDGMSIGRRIQAVRERQGKSRPDETVQQWCSRLASSCYRCGQQYADAFALSLHEDRCGLTAKSGHPSQVEPQFGP